MPKPSWKEIARSRERNKAAEPTEVKAAGKRIGQTRDGEVLADFLSATMAYRPPPAGSEPGALRDFAAEQRVAQRILNLLEGDEDDDAG